MAAMVRIQNKQSQVLNLLLLNEKGQAYTKALLPRASVDVKAGELSQVVYDLLQRGHIAMNAVGMDESAPAPAKKKSEEL